MPKWIGVAALGIFSACNQPQVAPAGSATESAILQKGDSMASVVQGVLLKNVMQAVQEEGLAAAVDFCNEKALYLTDSAAGGGVQRLTDRNRNPLNAIRTEVDTRAWNKLRVLINDSSALQKHLICYDGSDLYYYKAITIGMSGCLSCHGVKGKDIAAETLAAILEKYPDDKATGYAMGMLRGMWKIKMTEK